MDSDEAWREYFQRSVAEVDVPDSRVVDVLSIAGTRVRRRQRLRSAVPVAAMAAAALAVAGIAGASQLLGRQGPDSPPVAAPVPSSASAPTAATILHKLERHLSATGKVSRMEHSTSGNGGSVDWLRFDDGRGPAAVAMVVERGPAGTAADWSCAVQACTLQTRPDGSVLMIEKRPGDGNGDGYQQWAVKLGRPDGVVIALTECNSDTPKGSVTRKEPPLSTTQLTSIVIDLAR